MLDSLSKTPKWVTPSRRIPSELRKPVRDHARQVGEIIWCWNLLNDHMFQLFALVLAAGNRSRSMDVAAAIWNSFQSDKAQREMLLSVAQAAYPALLTPTKDASSAAVTGDYLRSAIEWLVKQTNDLSKHRNDVAHVPVRFAIINENTIIPSVRTASGRAPAVSRLDAQPTAEIWVKLRGDLLALTSYCALLSLVNIHDGRRPWPRKPLLRCVPTNIQKPQKTKSRQPSASRKRQRKPSGK